MLRQLTSPWAAASLWLAVLAVLGWGGAQRAEAAPLFSPSVNFAVGTTPTSVTSADFNGDGTRDLAVANGGSASVSVLLGDGTGAFGPKTDFATGSTPSWVISADFNRDGKPDLAVANGGSASVSVLLGDGAGGFGPKTDFATGSTSPNSVTSADFNRDGKPDLAVARPDAGPSFGHVSVLLGDGAGAFAAKTDFAAGGFPLQVTNADFNNDGKRDLAVVNIGSSGTVLLGDGAGGFGTTTSFSTGSFPRSLTSGDFNQDGNRDLAAGNGGIRNGYLSVVLADGAGGYGPFTSFSAAAGPDSYAGPPAQPVSVTSADLNGDGKADLAAANNIAVSVGVVLGNGTGGFGAPANFATGSSPTSVTSADFNSDGRRDLAVGNGDSDNVSVLLGQSTAEPPAPVVPPPAPVKPPSVLPTCLGKTATIVASAGQTVITGTAGADVIVGGDADETIDGVGGADTICAGNGDDEIRGGAGNDTLRGGKGRDILLGGTGDDVLRGDAGKDHTGGGAGRDSVYGDAGNDVLDEQKLGGQGRDRLFGGSGNDRVRAAGGSRDAIDCGTGRVDSVNLGRGDRQTRCERVHRAT